MQHAEREILMPVQLCDRKGQLNPAAIGYARKPMIESNLSGNFLRKKKWNYWCIFGEEILFSVSVSHFDYAAHCSVYFLHYETQRFFEKTVTVPVARKLHMPDQVLGSLQFHHADLNIQLHHIQNETHITVSVPDFDNEILLADLHVLHSEKDDTLNVVVPWSRQLFQHTAKHHAMPVKGFVKIGDKRYDLQEDESFAVLDFGRGILPRETFRHWGMASQMAGNHRIGLNLGGKWTDGTGMTENAVFVDGKMTKISEDVIFNRDKSDYKKRWTIHTKFSDSVQLSFSPFFERESLLNVKFVKSEIHQLVGYFNGRIRLEDGSFLPIQQLLGTIEEHQAKW